MKKIIRKNILISLIKKEFAQVLRDRRMRGILFGSPLIMIILFGYAVNMDVNGTTLAVLDDDKSSISRGLIEKFKGSNYFTVRAYLHSSKELDSIMDNSEVETFIHIKRDLSKNIKIGKKSEIQVIIDGTDSTRGAIISSYVNEIIQGYFIKDYFKHVQTVVMYHLSSNTTGLSGDTGSPVMRKGVSVEDRYFFNPTLISRNYFLPGVIGFIIALITITLTSMSIVKERETGTMDQIIVSPIKSMEFIFGKTVPFGIIGFIDMFVVTLITIFWFNVPFKGNILFLFLAGLLYIVSNLAIGIFISTISRTQQQAMMSFFLYYFPGILFSGFAFPIYAMPDIIQVITYLNPMMYFITIIRGVFLKGVGMAVLWKELLFLLVFGSLLLYISSRRLRRRME